MCSEGTGRGAEGRKGKRGQNLHLSDTVDTVQLSHSVGLCPNEAKVVCSSATCLSTLFSSQEQPH